MLAITRLQFPHDRNQLPLTTFLFSKENREKMFFAKGRIYYVTGKASQGDSFAKTLEISLECWDVIEKANFDMKSILLKSVHVFF